jgi:putative addiction module killer protein
MNIDNPQFVLYKGQTYSIEQTAEFASWLESLRDRIGRVRILKRLRRLADGQFGDTKPVGEGVYELRFFFGPGYRVYYLKRGDVMILLLVGGDKDSQQRDIALAQRLAKEEDDNAAEDNAIRPGGLSEG